MEVKIRRERDTDRWWAYFIDNRRLLGVDEVGALSLDLFLNRDMSRLETAQAISREYDITAEQALVDLEEFLDVVERELSPERFTMIEQAQTSVPWGVELQITGECNLRCVHCLQRGFAGQMDTARALGIVDVLAAAGVFEISVLGGEPLTHPGVIPILKRCEEHELAVNVVTNGLLLDEQMVFELSSLPRMAAFVSLDGLESDHDFIRGEGTFRKAVAAINSLLRAGIETEILCTLTSRNIDRYCDVVGFCRSIGVVCNFNLFKPFRIEHAFLLPDPKKFFRTLIELFDMRTKSGYQVGLANSAIVSRLMGVDPQNECRATQSGLVINYSGQMVTCPSLEEAGRYSAVELPAFDDDWLEKWRTNPAFVGFKSCGLANCQAREYVFGKLFGKPDPYSADEFVKYLNECGH